MGTKLDIIYKNAGLPTNNSELEKSYFFMESPKESLEKLLPNYKICEFQNILIPTKMELLGNIRLSGLSIKETQTGCFAQDSIKDFNINYLKNSFPINKSKILDALIFGYLIEKNVCNPKQVRIIDYTKEEPFLREYDLKNYLEERKTNPEIDKENRLENILSFLEVLYDEKDVIKKLKNRTSKLIKNSKKTFLINPKYFSIVPKSLISLM